MQVSDTFPFNQPDCASPDCPFKVFQGVYCFQHVPWWVRLQTFLKEHKVTIHLRLPVTFVVRWRRTGSPDEHWKREIFRD